MNCIKGLTGIFATICFTFLGYEGLNFARERESKIRVYGLADIILDSDHADLIITIQEEGNDLSEINKRLAASINKLANFLKNQGFDAEEIIDEGITITDRYNSYYNSYNNYNRGPENTNAELPKNRFEVRNKLKVSSDKVNKVKSTVSDITKLLGDGLFFETNVYYSCKNFDSIRLKLVDEATTDSLKRAERIAKSTNCNLTGLKTVTCNRISILSGDRTTADDEWRSGENSFKKRFRLIVEAVYNKA